LTIRPVLYLETSGSHYQVDRRRTPEEWSLKGTLIQFSQRQGFRSEGW